MISNSVLQPNLNLKNLLGLFQISIFFNSDWLSNRAT